MRPVAIFTMCAIALAGCDQSPAPNSSQPKAAEAKPVTTKRAITASFDCDRARGQAQELVCGDANLAAMDREVARLGRLALEPAALADWAQQRDGCDKADELRQCVMSAAMLKIHGLRQGSEAARSESGLSVGPVAFRCDGLTGPVEATFVNSDPGAVSLEWGGQAIAIERVIAASGAKYEGRWDGQTYTFWNKGREATFTVPGKGDLSCSEQAD